MFEQPGPGTLLRYSNVDPGGVVVDWLSARPAEELSADEALETAAGWERMIAHAQAQQLAALDRFAQLRPDGDGLLNEFAADEVAPVLVLSRGAAHARVELATALAQRLPETLAALRAGEIDLPRARVIVDYTQALDPEAAAAVQDRVLPGAPRRTAGQLRAACARAVLAVDPDAAQRRHEHAKTRRRVEHFPQPDGMGSLWANLTADEATAAYARLDTLARSGPADGRSMDTRRADALVDLVCGRDDGAQIPPVATTVGVTMSADTLAGLTDDPGHLDGHGPIPAAMARDLAAAARRWRGLITDEHTGDLTDVTQAYRPRLLLQEYIRARDVTCRFPGCRQPAARCDLDHTTPHGTGGATCRCNLGPFCRHHHRLKHESDWVVTQPEPGAFLFISPTGRTYLSRAPAQVEPEIQLIDHRSPPPF